MKYTFIIILVMLLAASCQNEQAKNDRRISSVSQVRITRSELNAFLTTFFRRAPSERDRELFLSYYEVCLADIPSRERLRPTRERQYYVQCTTLALTSLGMEILGLRFNDTVRRQYVRRFTERFVFEIDKKIFKDVHKCLDAEGVYKSSFELLGDVQGATGEEIAAFRNRSIVLMSRENFNAEIDFDVLLEQIRNCQDATRLKITELAEQLEQIYAEPRDRNYVYRRAMRILNRIFPEAPPQLMRDNQPIAADDTQTTSTAVSTPTASNNSPPVSQMDRMMVCAGAEIGDANWVRMDCDHPDTPLGGSVGAVTARQDNAGSGDGVRARIRVEGDFIVGTQYADQELQRSMQECVTNEYDGESGETREVPCPNTELAPTILNHHQDILRGYVQTQFAEGSAMYRQITRTIDAVNLKLQGHENIDGISREDFVRLVNAFEVLTELDVFHNMGEHTIRAYVPILFMGDRERLNYRFRSCMGAIYQNIWNHRTQGRRLSNARGIMSMVNRELENNAGHMQIMRHMHDVGEVYSRQLVHASVVYTLRSIIVNPEYSVLWARSQAINCYEQVADDAFIFFKEFLLAQVIQENGCMSNSSGCTDLERERLRGYRERLTANGESFEDVLRSILDAELLSLIMRLANSENIERDVLRDWRDIPLSRELAFRMLFNFIQKVGTLLHAGYFYNPDAMKTGLVTLKGELKILLEAVVAAPRQFRLRDLDGHFENFNAIVPIASAYAAEITFFQFDHLARNLKELRRGRLSRTNDLSAARSLQLETDYNQMIRTSMGMIRSSNFDVILRPNGMGRDYVRYFFNNVFMPMVTGKQVTLRTHDEVIEMLGRIIPHSNGEGEYMDRVTSFVARRELEWRDSRLGRIFSIGNDFDWRNLKRTRSGAEAVRYFTWRIIHPLMFTRDGLHEDVFNQRMDWFIRLIEQAQSENDN